MSKADTVRSTLYEIVLDPCMKAADRIAAARAFLNDASPSADGDAVNNVNKLAAAITGVQALIEKEAEGEVEPKTWKPSVVQLDPNHKKRLDK